MAKARARIDGEGGLSPRFGMRPFRYFTTVALLLASTSLLAQTPDIGVLIMAHGGSRGWNDHVRDLATRVSACAPAEVAFGMATRSTLQAAAAQLESKGVRQIVAVPLFVSSHSSIIEATQYLLGVRAEAPPQLSLFARMDHGAAHGPTHSPESGTTPVQAIVPIRMTAALDSHPIVAAILAARAREVSRDPAAEVLIIVAHGPEDEASNDKWLAEMRTLSQRVAAEIPFARVEYQTVRDDADPGVRSRAAAELRSRVEVAVAEKKSAVIVPLLLSYGGIEAGIRKRLDGLSYTMSTSALLPDPRLVDWVVESAGLAGCL